MDEKELRLRKGETKDWEGSPFCDSYFTEEESSCCALTHLAGLDDITPIQALREWKKQEAEKNVSYIAVTLPKEKRLERKLDEVGFEKLTTIKRRPSMGSGRLTLWIYRG